MRKWLCAAAAAAATAGLAVPAPAAGYYGPLIGLWQIDSFTLENAAKQVTKPLGEHPGGYLVYTNGGHIMLVFTGDNRPPPVAGRPSEAQAAQYLKTAVAVAGTYKVTGKNRVAVTVEAAADPVLAGKDLPRDFKVSGNRLTVTFKGKNPADGQDAQFTVNFHRVE